MQGAAPCLLLPAVGQGRRRPGQGPGQPGEERACSAGQQGTVAQPGNISGNRAAASLRFSWASSCGRKSLITVTNVPALPDFRRGRPFRPLTRHGMPMSTAPLPQLILTVPHEAIAGFASLLQHGMLCAVDRPVAVLPFLLSLPGFTEEYIEKSVQTIFINGIAVDRLDRVVAAGSTVALSAAMPGLAGAIFRRQGLHGSLRSQPEAQALPLRSESASGFVTLKLFNSIAGERVAALLTNGILIAGRALCSFAARQPHLFRPPVTLVCADQGLGYAELLQTLAQCPVLAVRARLLPER